MLHLLDAFKLDDVSHLSVFEDRNIEFRTHSVSSGSTIIFSCATEFVLLFSLFVGQAHYTIQNNHASNPIFHIIYLQCFYYSISERRNDKANHDDTKRNYQSRLQSHRTALPH
jgi:hypothetical protein